MVSVSWTELGDGRTFGDILALFESFGEVFFRIDRSFAESCLEACAELEIPSRLDWVVLTHVKKQLEELPYLWLHCS